MRREAGGGGNKTIFGPIATTIGRGDFCGTNIKTYLCIKFWVQWLGEIWVQWLGENVGTMGYVKSEYNGGGLKKIWVYTPGYKSGYNGRNVKIWVTWRLIHFFPQPRYTQNSAP